MNKLRDLIEHAAKSPIPPRLQEEEEEEEEEEAKKQRRNLIIIPINQCIITVYALYGACWPTPLGQNWRSGTNLAHGKRTNSPVLVTSVSGKSKNVTPLHL